MNIYPVCINLIVNHSHITGKMMNLNKL